MYKNNLMLHDVQFMNITNQHDLKSNKVKPTDISIRAGGGGGGRGGERKKKIIG